MEKNKFIMLEKLPCVKDISREACIITVDRNGNEVEREYFGNNPRVVKPDRIIPNLEAVVPKDFDMKKYLDIMKKTGIMLVESRVTLIEVNSNVKVDVSKSAIDWLEMHDLEWIDGVKYYIVGNLKYKIDGKD